MTEPKRQYRKKYFFNIYQWFCVVLLLVVLFWDCEFSDFVNNHIVFVGIFIIILAVLVNIIDYYISIRNLEKETHKKQNQ